LNGSNETIILQTVVTKIVRYNTAPPMFGGAVLIALNWIKRGTLWSETPIFDP
jgi:hypothetical protein